MKPSRLRPVYYIRLLCIYLLSLDRAFFSRAITFARRGDSLARRGDSLARRGDRSTVRSKMFHSICARCTVFFDRSAVLCRYLTVFFENRSLNRAILIITVQKLIINIIIFANI
jgi:hypothetical protein